MLSDVNLDIDKDEIVGIVGESGSGKTTLGKLLVTLEPVDSGKFYFMGKEVNNSTINFV
ncbi:MAG: ATP-binding cassette domain-containing protein, partial [Thermocladium sp.]